MKKKPFIDMKARTITVWGKDYVKAAKVAMGLKAVALKLKKMGLGEG